MLNLKTIKNKIVDGYYFFHLIYQVFKKWNKERICPTCGSKTWPGKIQVATVTLASGKEVPIELVVRACANNCPYHMDQTIINLEGEQLTIDEFLYVAERLDKKKALWYFRDLFKQTQAQNRAN